MAMKGLGVISGSVLKRLVRLPTSTVEMKPPRTCAVHKRNPKTPHSLCTCNNNIVDHCVAVKKAYAMYEGVNQVGLRMDWSHSDSDWFKSEY